MENPIYTGKINIYPLFITMINLSQDRLWYWTLNCLTDNKQIEKTNNHNGKYERF